MIKTKENRRGRQGGKTLSYLLVGAIVLCAAASARAANYDFTGEQDNNWGTAKNWRAENGGAQQTSVPSGSNNLNFRPTSKINASFQANPVVNIGGKYSTTWKLHVRNLGTEAAPVVFNASSDANGVTAGGTKTSDNTGYYIANDSGDVWLRLQRGTYNTGTGGFWFVGNTGFSGHIVTCSGVTMGCSQQFQLKQGSFSATNTAFTVGTQCYFGYISGKNVTVYKKDGTWTLKNNAHFGEKGNCDMIVDGGTIDINSAANLFIGNPGNGSLTIKDGEVKTTGSSSGVIYIGRGTGGVGSVTLDGANAAMTSGGDVYVGQNGGTGTLTVSNGTFTTSSAKWTVIDSNSSGTINLAGGTFKTKRIRDNSGSGGTALLVFDGGTLMANGTSDALVDSTVDVKVKAGGATIDTGTFDINIAAPLDADTGVAGDLTVTGGGSATFTAAGDLSGAFTIGENTALHWFDQDGVVSNYAATAISLAPGATLALDADATGCDAFAATTTNITATAASPATFKLIVRSMPESGRAFPLFAIAEADTNKVAIVAETPAGAPLVVERGYADGCITYAILAKDYTWNDGSNGGGWTDGAKWDVDGASAEWADNNNAVFATEGDVATLDADVTAVKLDFQANATVGVSGDVAVTVPEVAVASGISATLNAPVSGAFEKIGAGTLTLGTSRTEQTFVTEGTLAMANGATIAPTKLTLGTDPAKPVTFDYGGQTLTGDPAAYIATGMDITLANGAFEYANTIWYGGTGNPAALTVASGATLQSGGHFTLTPYGEMTVNVAGGTMKSTKNEDSWLIQASLDGRLNVNVTDGGLLEFGGETYALTCRDTVNGSTDYQSPSLYMKVVDSTLRVANGKSLRLGYDGNNKNPVNPTCVFAATNSLIDIAYGIYVGHNAVGTNTAGSYTVDFENCVITAKQISVYHDRPLNAVRFNNVRYVLNADSNYSLETVAAFETLGEGGTAIKPMTIDAGGLTIDNNNHYGQLRADPQGPGAFIKTGTGPFAIMRNQTAIAPLIVSNDVMRIDGGLSIARPTTIAPGATLKTSGAATFSSGITLESGATLDVSGTNAVAVGSLTLPVSGTAALTVAGAAVPKGLYPVFSGVTVADVEGKLVPTLASGATAYQYLVKDSTLYLAVDTDLSGFVWTGLAGDGKMSTAGNWWNGSAPGEGDAVDFAGVTVTTTIEADIDATFGAVTMGPGIVVFTGDKMRATSFSDTTKVSVGTDATVTLVGDLMFSGSGSNYVIYRVNRGGKFIVTGKVGLASGAAGNLQAQYNPGTGIIVAGSLVNDSTNWIFAARDDNATTQHWAIGPGGITGTATDKGMWVYSNNKVNPEFQPYTNDFTVSLWTVLRESAKSWTYNTTGLDDLGHTITLDAGFSDKTAPIYVTGKGKVVVNHVTKSFGGKNAYSGPVTVKDTATLSINAGKKLTSGAITVNSGATLELAESGTNTLGGALSLQDGATLKFNFTERRTAPVLDLSKGVTFGNATNITVSVVGERPAYHGAPDGKGRYALTSGYNFSTAGATIARAGDCPAWVKSIGLDDSGNIVADILLKGFLVIVN